MTQITLNDVQRLAELSSIALTGDEIKALQTDISNILGYVEQLGQLDTDKVLPTYQVTDLENVWRDDVVDDYGIDQDALLALAPESKDAQIKVPKVL